MLDIPIDRLGQEENLTELVSQLEDAKQNSKEETSGSVQHSCLIKKHLFDGFFS